jgi:hypothetical protein
MTSVQATPLGWRDIRALARDPDFQAILRCGARSNYALIIAVFWVATTILAGISERSPGRVSTVCSIADRGGAFLNVQIPTFVLPSPRMLP